MCGIIYHPEYSRYNLGEGHPFDPVRIEIVLDLLNELNLLQTPVKPEPVTVEQLYQIHDKDYVDAVERLSAGDNTVGMAEASRYQAGGTLLGARMLIENKANKVLQMGGGFHHAHSAFASGFCIYNDLALALKEFSDAGWHVVYLDLDVHHGDGVQEIFYSSENVMTISFHESGEYLFPGSGWLYELGQGMGRSLKLNIPLEPYTEGDSYFEVMNSLQLAGSNLMLWLYRPELMLILQIHWPI